jgi:hypothetical protein
MSQNENYKGKSLKVKDQELKNAFKLVEILKKDKENLTTDLKEKTEQDKLLNLEEKKKKLDNKNQSLVVEIKHLQKLIEEHKRCPDNTKSYDDELKSFKEEIYQLKLKNKEILAKITEEQNKHTKTKAQLDSIKIEVDTLKNNCDKLKQDVSNATKANTNNVTLNTNKLNTNSQLNSIGYKPFFNQYDPYTEVVISKKNKILKKKKEKLEEAFNKEQISSQRGQVQLSYLSKSLLMTSTNLNSSNEIEINKLFQPKEKIILERLLTKEEIDLFEDKYESVEKSRIETEKRYRITMKELLNKVGVLNETMKFTELEFKETEQKSKIYGYQINEYKSEQRIQQDKIEDLQRKIDILNHSLKDKNNQNQILIAQINQLQKLNQYQLERQKILQRKKEKSEESIEENKTLNKTEKSNDEQDDEEEYDKKYNIKPQKNKGLD